MLLNDDALRLKTDEQLRREIDQLLKWCFDGEVDDLREACVRHLVQRVQEAKRRDLSPGPVALRVWTLLERQE